MYSNGTSGPHADRHYFVIQNDNETDCKKFAANRVEGRSTSNDRDWSKVRHSVVHGVGYAIGMHDRMYVSMYFNMVRSH